QQARIRELYGAALKNTSKFDIGKKPVARVLFLNSYEAKSGWCNPRLIGSDNVRDTLLIGLREVGLLWLTCLDCIGSTTTFLLLMRTISSFMAVVSRWREVFITRRCMASTCQR
ncbi:unnamed protein product, partial [Polarella glacialis]